jgi:hypothetical protein
LTAHTAYRETAEDATLPFSVLSRCAHHSRACAATIGHATRTSAPCFWRVCDTLPPLQASGQRRVQALTSLWCVCDTQGRSMTQTPNSKRTHCSSARTVGKDRGLDTRRRPGLVGVEQQGKRATGGGPRRRPTCETPVSRVAPRVTRNIRTASKAHERGKV